MGISIPYRGRRLTRFIAEVGTATATFLGLVALSLDKPAASPLSIGATLIVVIAVGTTLASIALSFSELTRGPRVFKDDRAVRDYLYNWIARGGRVAIFSRDLSWVDDSAMEDLLRRKAAADDLELVVPRPIARSTDLEAHGAKVTYYPHLDYIIKSRFTIVNVGRGDAQVAIGYRTADGHSIEEIRAGDPAFHLAEDMLEVIRRFTREPLHADTPS